MRSRSLARALAALITLSALLVSLKADVIPSGWKRIPASVVVDYGPFEDHVERVYVVRAGDSLVRIAQKELGDLKRFEEIAELNGIERPEFLKVGQKLILPAREKKPVRHLNVAFFLVQGMPDRAPIRICPGDEVPFVRYGARLVALRTDRLKDVTDEHGKVEAAKLRTCKAAKSYAFSFPRHVPETSKATKARTTLELKGLTRDALQVIERVEYLGQESQVIERKLKGNVPGLVQDEGEKKRRRNLFLILTTFTGASGLILLFVKRRRTHERTASWSAQQAIA